ncbi:hypothetical protein [Xenorhabdus japonica]|nr:hypothetical protein [Xenorhabdus japonica]
MGKGDCMEAVLLMLRNASNASRLSFSCAALSPQRDQRPARQD